HAGPLTGAPRHTPRRAAGGRDGLPFLAPPALPRQAQRARLSRDHGRPRGRAAERTPGGPGRAHVGERPGAVPAMSNPVREAVLFLRGQINTKLSQGLNARDRTPPVVPPPFPQATGPARPPLAP